MQSKYLLQFLKRTSSTCYKYHQPLQHVSQRCLRVISTVIDLPHFHVWRLWGRLSVVAKRRSGIVFIYILWCSLEKCKEIKARQLLLCELHSLIFPETWGTIRSSRPDHSTWRHAAAFLTALTRWLAALREPCGALVWVMSCRLPRKLLCILAFALLDCGWGFDCYFHQLLQLLWRQWHHVDWCRMFTS